MQMVRPTKVTATGMCNRGCSSPLSCSGSSLKGIVWRLWPFLPLFSTHSTRPLQSAGTLRVTLRLLVNVWSLFLSAVVGGWSTTDPSGCCKPRGTFAPLRLLHFQGLIPGSSCAAMASSPVKGFLVDYFMPEKCYEEIFINLHVHVPCLKFVLNRVAGFCIILDTFLAQLPQILKILWTGSAEGVNVAAVLLQLYAFSCPVIYAMSSNFPFFAWAERLFTLPQTAAIAFLVLHYRGDTLKGLLLLSGFGGAVFLLGSYAGAGVSSAIQASSLPALIASKLVQMMTNYHNGHAGQLSTLSLSLTWTGSLGVVSVSLQETGISLESLPHMLSACLSFVLLVQVLRCMRSSATAAKKRD